MQFKLLKLEKILAIYFVITVIIDILSTILVMNRYGVYHEEISESNPFFWFFLRITDSIYASFFFTGIIAYSVFILLIFANRLVNFTFSNAFYKLYCCILPLMPIFVIVNNLTIWYFQLLPLFFLMLINIISLSINLTAIGFATTSLIIASDREKKDKTYLESFENYRKKKKEDVIMYCSGLLFISFILGWYTFQIFGTLTFIVGCLAIITLSLLIIDAIYRFKTRIEISYERAIKKGHETIL